MDEHDGPAGFDLHGKPFGTWAEIQADAVVSREYWLARAEQIDRRLADPGVPDAERADLDREMAGLVALMGVVTVGRPFSSFLEMQAEAGRWRAGAIMDRLGERDVPDVERAELRDELAVCRTAIRRYFPGG
jgi:hypothetical protein